MDLDFTEEHEMLRDMARGVLAEYSPLEVVREQENDERGYPDALWKQLVELGLVGILIPEQFGGQGLGDQFADKIDEFADNYLKANNGENYMTVFSQVHGEKIMEVIKEKISIDDKAVSVDEFQKIVAN